MWPLIIFLAVLTNSSWARYLPPADAYFVNGCRIFGGDGRQRKTLPGDHCVFLANGDYISASRHKLRYFTKDASIRWEKQGFYHHMLNLSQDRRRLLVLDSVAKKIGSEEVRRYDRFLILDLSGNTIAEADATDLLAQVKLDALAFYPNKIMKTDESVANEGSHFNSFYEVPEGVRGAEQVEALRPGNFILNSLGLGVFILDSQLKKVLYHTNFRSSQMHSVHDVQVTKTGRLLYFNNRAAGSTGTNMFSTVEEYDLAQRKVVFEFRSNPEAMFYSESCGGVQEVTSDLILITDSIAGVFMYSRSQRRLVWSTKAFHFTGEALTVTQDIKQESLTDFLKIHGALQ